RQEFRRLPWQALLGQGRFLFGAGLAVPRGTFRLTKRTSGRRRLAGSSWVYRDNSPRDEEALSWSRPTCPLTGPRLAASLMWAQGSCEFPKAKPGTRRFLARSGASFLITTLYCSPPAIQVHDHNDAFPSHTGGYQPTETHSLQSGPQLTGRVVPS